MRFAELLEGGNVFGENTGRIAKENIQPTLDRYYAELQQVFPKAGISPNKFHPVGSVGLKSTSGDIDLAVDATVLFPRGISTQTLTVWNIDPSEFVTRFDQFKKRARTSTDEQVAMKTALVLISEYANEHASNIHMDPKKVTPGNAFGMFPQYDEQGSNLNIGVQIDWMVGNLDWLKFSYASANYPEDSNVKGLHRTQLMLAMFQATNHSFDHKVGVKDKATGEVVAGTPDDTVALLNELFGLNLSVQQLANYHTLHDAIKGHPLYDNTMQIYLKILDRTRVDIPDDLQEYWIQHKDEFGLTGKFLPDDSNLKTVEEGVRDWINKDGSPKEFETSIANTLKRKSNKTQKHTTVRR